jgi:integrase
VLTAEDLARLLPALPEWMRPVVRFAFCTGWRRGEILGLTWARVDFERGEIRLEPKKRTKDGGSKNKQGRVYPFEADPELKALLEECRDVTRDWERRERSICKWVFHKDGSCLLDPKDPRRAIQAFRVAWEKARKAIGKPGARIHDFRRTAVTNLIDAGVDEGTAMKLTGHKTRSVFDRYNVRSVAAQRQGVAQVAAYRARSLRRLHWLCDERGAS